MKIIINGEAVEVSGGGGSSIPTGGIIIWSGAVNGVPDGWALCDGQNGTPDLRDRFVLGAGTSHAVGSTGGEENVTLTVEQMPEHAHGIDTVAKGWQYYNGAQTEDSFKASKQVTGQNVDTTYDSGSSQPHPNMPPYYTLAYIMKL